MLPQPKTERCVYPLILQHVAAAGCALGTVIGKTGHNTTAFASVDLIGTIFVLVRSEGSPLLNVYWKDMPKDVEIRVLDWRNELLPDGKGSPSTDPYPATGSGGHDFQTRSAGLYRVEARVHLSASVGGNVNSDARHQSAELSVNVADGGN